MIPLSTMSNLAWMIPLVAAAALLAAGVTIFNGLVRLKNDCDKAWGNIDVLLKQRYDELPNLVNVCKGYMEHEKETLARVTEARARGMAAADPESAGRAADATGAAMSGLYAVAENYPDLKADEQFLRLQKRITGIESEIADRREYFNDCVNNYNVRIEQIPDIFVARLLSYSRRSMLKLPDAARPVSVDWA